MSVDGVFFRRMAYLGARYGPRSFVKHSPPLIGLCFALGLPMMRRRIRENMRQVMGPRQSIVENFDAVRTFMNYASCLAEGLAMERPEAQSARLSVEGEEHLAAALATGKGLILLTAHVGPFEAAARYFTDTHQAKIMVVMNKESNAAARRFHDELRRRTGVLVTHVGEHPVDALPVMGHLQRGGVAAIQLDRMPAHARQFEARLFGNGWRLPEGPFRLAALCQVPLMTAFARRRGFFDYEISLGQPIEVARRDLEQAHPTVVQRLAGEVERAILRDPTQWFHFARRTTR